MCVCVCVYAVSYTHLDVYKRQAFASEPNANYAAIKLQRQLDAYVGWTDDCRLAVNASKSAAVIFSRKRKRPRPLKVGPVEVPWTNSVKYLGLHVDSRLTWRTHTQYIRQRASALLSRLWPVLSNPCLLYTSRCV